MGSKGKLAVSATSEEQDFQFLKRILHYELTLTDVL